MNAAAVLAVPSTETLLAEVAALNGDEAADGLIGALRAAVLRETASGLYGFRHMLAQQVAYRHIPGPWRTRLHRRALDELQTHDPLPLVQIAHHTLAVGDQQGWLDRTEQAAEQAVALGDTGTAGTLLQQILAQSGADTERRSRAALALARIVNFGVDYAATVRELRAVLADPRPPAATRGEIRLELGLTMLNIDRDPAGFRELEHAIGELATLPHKAVKAMIALALHDLDGAATQGWKWLGRAEQAVADGTDEASRMVVRNVRLLLMARDGDPAVWPLVDRLPRRGADGVVLSPTIFALYNLTTAAIQLGHDRRARALLLEMRDLADGADGRPFECLVRAQELNMDRLVCRWADLDGEYAALGRAHPDMRQVEVDRLLCQGHRALAQGLALPGPRPLRRRRGARRHLGGRHHEDRRRPHGRPARPARPAGCLGGRRTGVVDVAWTRFLDTDLRSASRRGRGRVGLRAPRGGRTTRDGGRVRCPRPGRARCPVRTGSGPGAAAAPRHRADGDHRAGESRRALRRGAAQMAGHWPAYEATKAAEHRGDALACSSPEDAVAHLADAARGFTELGATGDAARCQHRLRELGVQTSPPGSRGYGMQLSPREREVAELLAGGATNQDIAQTLFLSPAPSKSTSPAPW